MNKSTHWIHADLDAGLLPKNICTTPEEAARAHVIWNDSGVDNHDDAFLLDHEEFVRVLLQGLIETTELITDPEKQIGGYEPGQTWYKKPGEKATVRVSLKFEVIDSTVEKFGATNE